MRLCLTTVVEVTGPIAVTVTNREFSTVTIHVERLHVQNSQVQMSGLLSLVFLFLAATLRDTNPK